MLFCPLYGDPRNVSGFLPFHRFLLPPLVPELWDYQKLPGPCPESTPTFLSGVSRDLFHRRKSYAPFRMEDGHATGQRPRVPVCISSFLCLRPPTTRISPFAPLSRSRLQILRALAL